MNQASYKEKVLVDAAMSDDDQVITKTFADRKFSEILLMWKNGSFSFNLNLHYEWSAHLAILILLT